MALLLLPGVAARCDGMMPRGPVALQRVDPTVLARLVDDLGEDHAREVCALFLTDAADIVGAVDAALGSGDAAAAARLAHRLKSASGFVGAEGCARLCAEIERLVRDDRLVDVRPRLELLADELGHVSAELAALTT
jgi:HPt (histidine-containing phosphotransfer) domain-containing protein